MKIRILLLPLLCVLLCAGLLHAGDSRTADHVKISVTDIPNPVHYYVMKPQGYTPTETYPLLIVIPGSHDPEAGGVENNRGKKGVHFWAYQGTEKFFTISVWYGNENNAYPHGKRPNATIITDAMIRDVLHRFPIDRNRVFLQAFSQGGLTVKNLLRFYHKDAPFRFAGILLTDANCRGGNANTDCVSSDTAVFVGVGSEDKQPAEPFNNVQEAEAWVRIFKNKCPDLKHHIIEGQGHNPGPEMLGLVKEWFKRVLEDIGKREITNAAKNWPRAVKYAQAGMLGRALLLVNGAQNHDREEDNKAFNSARELAILLHKELRGLKKKYLDNKDKNQHEAAVALLTMHKAFKNHPIGKWAYNVLKKNQKKKTELGRVIGKAFRVSKEHIEDLNNKVKEIL